MKKKKTSILGRSKGSSASRRTGAAEGVPKKRKHASHTEAVVLNSKKQRGHSRGKKAALVQAQSDILRQAAYAVGRLVEADATGKHGVSLKSLTLGKHVRQKKAVYAVTVETLKYYSVLKSLVDVVFGDDYGGMSQATLCVLVREIVLGDGVSRIGRAERLRKHASHTEAVVLSSKKHRGHSRGKKAALVQAQSDILRQAAYAVGRLVEADATGKHGVSLKSLTLGKHVRQKKAVYAVTVETLKHYSVLKSLVNVVFGDDYGGMSEATLCVLVREIVLGDGVSRIGRAERLVLGKEEELRRQVAKLVEQSGVESVSEMLPQNDLMMAAERRKRTMRVNMVKASLDDVKNEFRSGRMSEHVCDVLELDPRSDLHSHPFVRDGKVVLQSLSSCIPAFVLDPEPQWHVIDACAAPGNKTTHLASIMFQKAREKGQTCGKVFAFDKDDNRLERLKGNVALTGTGSIVHPSCRDFLETDPCEFDRVDAILLDPSCSGSGTVLSRMDYLLPNSSQHVSQRGVMYDDERVQSLKQFQISAIQHAMTFPNVQRIVYSTCSIYYEENEGVVAHVLEFAQEHGFSLAEVLPSWPRRGLVLQEEEERPVLPAEEAQKVLRIDPIEDGSDGFFVAMFVK